MTVLVNPFTKKPSAQMKQPTPKAECRYAVRKQAQDRFLRFLKSDAYLILDTETTGLLNQPGVKIIELSIINTRGETLFTSLFNPGASIPEKITEITGITDEMVVEAPKWEDLEKEILTLLVGKNILGWNVGFDIKMLCIETGLREEDFDYLDVMNIYSYATGHGRMCKLKIASKEQKIEEEQDHRSLGDCLMTLEVMRRFSGFSEDQI